MEDVEKVFGNIKSLQSMASIEAIVASAVSIDNTFVQKIDVEKTSHEEILKPLVTDLLVTHQLFKLKLLLKDAEISALSDRIEDNSNGKSNLNDAGIPHINSLMNDIKLAVSNATNSTSIRHKVKSCRVSKHLIQRSCVKRVQRSRQFSWQSPRAKRRTKQAHQNPTSLLLKKSFPCAMVIFALES